MSITVVKQPTFCCLAKNEVKYTLETDNNYTTPGVAFSQSFTIVDTVGGPVNNETFQITWTDADDVAQSITYTFKTVPSGSNAIKVIAGQDVDKWAIDYLIPVMMRDYPLNRDYFVKITASSSSSVTVTIEAKENGDAWDMTNSESVTDMSFAAATTGTDAVARSNFQIFVNILFESVFDSGEFEKIAELAAEVNEDAQADFFIEKILQGAMTKNLDIPIADVPEYNESDLKFCENIIRKFRLYHAESYGDVAEVQTFNAIRNTKRLIFGSQKPNIFFLDGFYDDYCSATAGQKFLTNQPSSIDVNKTMHLYLYCFIPTNDDVDVVILIDYTDGSLSTQFSFQVTPPADKENNIIIIPVGYAQLDLDTKKGAGKTVSRWSVHIDFTGNYETEKKYFNIDQRKDTYARNYYFLFQNALGGFDSLWCTGIKTSKAKIKYQENEKMIIDNSDFDTKKYLKPKRQTKDNAYTNLYELSTGPKSKAYIEYLKEFLSSQFIFEVIDGAYIPLIIQSSDVELFNDVTKQYILKFTYLIEDL
ncbi:MAG: hypothetical protein U9Q69_00220 [Nanoarchaeota archaeon]|nr:hypothetical protein [Nanoarchaeota archaeon]